MNVLLTCAGRRFSLVRLFMAAVHPRGGLVLACDAGSLAPTLAIADLAVQLPLLSAEDCFDVRIRAMRENEVGLVVPTIDPELPLLAAARSRIEEAGARVLVSSTRFLGSCGDKWRTCQEFGERGIDVPASWMPAEFDPAEAPTDLFVNPRRRSSSRDVHAVLLRSIDRERGAHWRIGNDSSAEERRCSHDGRERLSGPSTCRRGLSR